MRILLFLLFPICLANLKAAAVAAKSFPTETAVRDTSARPAAISLDASPTVVPKQNLYGPSRLTLGVGSNFGSKSKLVSRYRASYAYRLTPLFSLGGSLNYSEYYNRYYYPQIPPCCPACDCIFINTQEMTEKNRLFSTELEANMYFVHSRLFNFFVTAGYGWRRGTAPDYTAARSTTPFTDAGFSLGINFEYAIRPGWSIGVRADTRRIRIQNPDYFHEDNGLMIQLGKKL